VPPEQATIDGFERIALAVQTRDEGMLVPAFGRSGIGKTTLLDNLTHFLPQQYSQTLNYQGDISFDALEHAAGEFTHGYPLSETRVFPINVDHRENAPPSDRQLADIKRFLRVSTCSVRPIIIWSDTSEQNTRDITTRYTKVAGENPVDLPIE
jgi:energy-coupling factor transporter ATP-binding protein EcfA2